MASRAAGEQVSPRATPFAIVPIRYGAKGCGRTDFATPTPFATVPARYGDKGWGRKWVKELLPRAAERDLSFFKMLRGAGKLNWTPECQAAFDGLRQYLQHKCKNPFRKTFSADSVCRKSSLLTITSGLTPRSPRKCARG
jgi:hypothetical protein